MMKFVPSIRLLVIMVCLVSLSNLASAGSSRAPDQNQTYIPMVLNSKGLANAPIPDQYIVVFKDDPTLSLADATQYYVNTYNANVLHTYSDALSGFAIRIPPQNTARVLAALASDPRVKSVVQDTIVMLNDDGEENLTISAVQSGVVWGLDRIDQRKNPLSNTYAYLTTGAGVRAYIIDTGIYVGHSEFGGRAVDGYDAVDGWLPAADCEGHGTHVAGTVGGSTYGVAKGVQLVAVRVLDCNGSGANSGVIAGINWVTQQKRNNPNVPMVANMSLGGDVNTLVDDAVANSIAAGVTYVVAAGNDAANACYYSPARLPAAITVAATASNDSEPYFSNYGSCVDIYAPGEDIGSATNTGYWDWVLLSGTSMASPHVAGVAALYLQRYPRATPAVVTRSIIRAATPNIVTNISSGSPNRLLYSLFQREWRINYMANGLNGWDWGGPEYGGGNAQPVPADYDGDGKADLSVKVDDSRWLIDYSRNGFGGWDVSFSGYGSTEMRPVPADYDGDGKADLSVKTDGGHWIIDYASNGFGGWDTLLTSYGGISARPVPADYDGDGRADLSIKGDDGSWLIDYASNGFGSWNVRLTGYGNVTARPVPADYDGDGKADLSIKGDDGGWLIDYARNGFGSWDVHLTGYGNATARPVPADYDGDGKADLSVKGNDGGWLIDFARNGFGVWDWNGTGYGNADAYPAPADYDGDRKADLAVKTDSPLPTSTCASNSSMVGCQPGDKRVLVMGNRLLVNNASGSVRVHTITTSQASLPTQMTGYLVASQSWDRFVNAYGSQLMVFNTYGEAWTHNVTNNYIGYPYNWPSPSAIVQSVDKYVVVMGTRLLVINTLGEVWAHNIVNNTIGNGYLLSGYKVATQSNDKHVVAMGTRLLVVNSYGDVRAYNVSSNSVGAPYNLTGSKAASQAWDKYVVAMGTRLLVINTGGSVWAHDVGATTIGGGYLLGVAPKVAAPLEESSEPAQSEPVTPSPVPAQSTLPPAPEPAEDGSLLAPTEPMAPTPSQEPTRSTLPSALESDDLLTLAP